MDATDTTDACTTKSADDWTGLSIFLVALVGCLFESLLATYDVRGRVRQVFFFVIFMFL